MQLAALPIDEKNRPRTIPDYPHEYTPSYAESEREYMSELAKNLQQHRESIGKPEHDPLAMPIDIGAANITKIALARKMAEIPKDMIELLKQKDTLQYINPEFQSKAIRKAAGRMLEKVPSSITDFIEDFTYRPVDERAIQEHIYNSPSAGWNTSRRTIELSPAASIRRPEYHSGPTAMTGHEIGHAAMQLIRSIIGSEDKLIAGDSFNTAYKIANKHKIRLAPAEAKPGDNMYRFLEKNLEDPYSKAASRYQYKDIPEERVAEAYGQTVSNLSDEQRIHAMKSGYVTPMLNDFLAADAINKLLKTRK